MMWGYNFDWSDTAIYEQMRERLVAAVARENQPLTVHR